jgi:hypothetical protein
MAVETRVPLDTEIVTPEFRRNDEEAAGGEEGIEHQATLVWAGNNELAATCRARARQIEHASVPMGVQ